MESIRDTGFSIQKLHLVQSDDNDFDHPSSDYQSVPLQLGIWAKFEDKRCPSGKPVYQSGSQRRVKKAQGHCFKGRQPI